MVEFSGKIENAVQAKVISKRSLFAGIVGIIIAIAGLIISLVIWLIERSLDKESMIILIGSILMVIIYGIICIPTSKKRLKFEWDYYIKFENEIITVVFNHQNGAVQSCKMSKIKKVIDYGEFYYLYLYRIDPSKSIVCQKDLLINGTIEEFEKLFEGKIRRKFKSI